MFGIIKAEDKLKLVENIISVSDVDTVFRDIYIEHARKLISGIFSIDNYEDIVREKKMLSCLPNRINEAIEKNDWIAVKELSKRMKDLNRWTEKNTNLFNLGRKLYSSNFIYINPFSPGLYHEAGINIDDLPAIRKDIIKKLSDIISADKSMKDFYKSRKDYFSSIQVVKEEDNDEFASGDDDLTEQARQALAHGDISRLEELSEKLISLNKQDITSLKEKDLADDASSAGGSEVRLSGFLNKTLKKALKMGLKPVRVEASPQYASLCRYAIRREFRVDRETAWKKILETDHLFKDGIPEPLKIRTEVFSRHLLINSMGTRHFPDFLTEDLLVEDFSEENIDGTPVSNLLEMLGFDRRNALSRMDIEHALFMNGYRIVKDELGLDPLRFKLVCIPADIYLGLGKEMGWGNRELWTHFDGYVVLQQSRFNAQAGGDKRFGGIFDLVTIGREYESDNVIVRFAVVQRKRMLKMV